MVTASELQTYPLLSQSELGTTNFSYVLSRICVATELLVCVQDELREAYARENAKPARPEVDPTADDTPLIPSITLGQREIDEIRASLLGFED